MHNTVNLGLEKSATVFLNQDHINVEIQRVLQNEVQ
jgi:hypothetical protein